MERSSKAQAAAAAAAAAPACRPSVATASLICAAFIVFAYISLITLSTPTLGSFPTHLRTVFGLLPTAPPEEADDVHGFLPTATPEEADDVDEGNRVEFESRVRQVFEKASMSNRTVILTTLNEAWANEGTMINLFLESFQLGYGTQRLLQHLVFICVDEKAYERCLIIHPHCLKINTHDVNLSHEQVLLSNNYIKLVWRRIKFLKTTLDMNFDLIFTDTDVLWFRDPFPLLQNDAKADIQVASDQYNENPWDIHNKPNTGFMYVRANERTRNFFHYWYEERKRNSRLATQGIFNIIKFTRTFQNIGMNLRFLDPKLFGGFCKIKETDMNKAITMHATCCKGLDAKLIDLKMIFEGWKKWQHHHTLSTRLFESKPFYNQSNMPPCNDSLYGISPKFDVPLACVKSLHT